jgi:hypothetical protein
MLRLLTGAQTSNGCTSTVTAGAVNPSPAYGYHHGEHMLSASSLISVAYADHMQAPCPIRMQVSNLPLAVLYVVSIHPTHVQHMLSIFRSSYRSR